MCILENYTFNIIPGGINVLFYYNHMFKTANKNIDYKKYYILVFNIYVLFI